MHNVFLQDSRQNIDHIWHTVAPSNQLVLELFFLLKQWIHETVLNKLNGIK